MARYRHRVGVRRSKRNFRRTASRVHRMNVRRRVHRGGFWF